MLWLFSALALASGLHERCADGERDACEAILEREARILATTLAAGDPLPHWRLPTFTTAVTQVSLLQVAEGTPHHDPSALHRACERVPAPACEDWLRARREAYVQAQGIQTPTAPRPAAPRTPPAQPWVPWPGMGVSHRAWRGDAHLVVGTSPGTLRWATHDGSIEVVVDEPRHVCAGPLAVGDAVHLVVGDDHRSCNALVRRDLRTGELLEERTPGVEIHGLEVAGAHLLVRTDDGYEVRDATGRLDWFLPGPPHAPSGLSADGQHLFTYGRRRSSVYRSDVADPVLEVEGPCIFSDGDLVCRVEEGLVAHDLSDRQATPVVHPLPGSMGGALQSRCGGAVVSFGTERWERRPCDERPAPTEGHTPDSGGTRAISGTVLGFGDEPMAGASVYLFDRSTGRRHASGHRLKGLHTMARAAHHTRTDGEGRFHFDEVDADVPWLVVVRGEFGQGQVGPLTPEARDPELTVDAPHGRTVQVQVVDTRGKPVRDGSLVATFGILPLDGQPLWVDPGEVWALRKKGIGALTAVSSEGLRDQDPTRVVVSRDGVPTCAVLTQSGSPHPDHEPVRCDRFEPDASLLSLAWIDADDRVEIRIPNQHEIVHPEGKDFAAVRLYQDGERVESRSFGMEPGVYDVVATRTEQPRGFRLSLDDLTLVEGTVTLEEGTHEAPVDVAREGPLAMRRVRLVDEAGTPLSGAHVAAYVPVLEATFPRTADYQGFVDIPEHEGRIQAWFPEEPSISSLAKPDPSLPDDIPAFPVPALDPDGSVPDPLSAVEGTWRRDDGQELVITAERWGEETDARVPLGPNVLATRLRYGGAMLLFADRDTMVQLDRAGRGASTVWRRVTD